MMRSGKMYCPGTGRGNATTLLTAQRKKGWSTKRLSAALDREQPITNSFRDKNTPKEPKNVSVKVRLPKTDGRA